MQLTMTGQIGTPIYMAPELFTDEHFGPGVDVYAFAIVAYEIVTGKQPYFELSSNISVFALSQKVMNGYRPQFTDDVTDKMKELISKCWSSNALDRPSFDTIFEQLVNDFSFLKDEVDKDEIDQYLSKIGACINQNTDMTIKIQNMSKQIEKVKPLINYSQELLCYECQEGNAEIVQKLISTKSVDVNIKNISMLYFLFCFIYIYFYIREIYF